MTRLAVVVAALAVVVAGCAGQTQVAQERSTASPRSAPSTSARTPTPTTTNVSTAAPTRPYVLKGRLHVGDLVVPGRFGVLTTAGDVWLAHRMDGPMAWGVGSSVHTLPVEAEAKLSTNGRWIAVSPGFDACMGNTGATACTLRLLDTTGKDAPRRVTIRRTLSARPGGTTQVDVLGVTGQGVVVVSVYDGGWQERYWDALGGAQALQSQADDRNVTDWTQDSGQTGVGPGGHWALKTAWAERGSDFSRRTTRVLEARRITGRRTTVRLHAPRGWSFAPSESGNLVFWESPTAFLMLVVDSRRGGDRLTRCNIRLATCVLVTG